MELTKKLLEVSKAIGYLQKDKKNTMQGYKYLSEAKIKETIKEQFDKQGIIFNYSTEEIREYEISSTSKGTKQFVTITKGLYQFIDADKPDKPIAGTWFGSGTDTGDKGLYKAITGGIKYVLNTNFLIPTGDDPEKDDDETEPGGKPDNKKTPVKSEVKSEVKSDLASLEQLKRMFTLSTIAQVDEEKFKNYIHERYGVSSSKELTRSQIEEVFNLLELKIEDNKQKEIENEDVKDFEEYERKEYEREEREERGLISGDVSENEREAK